MLVSILDTKRGNLIEFSEREPTYYASSARDECSARWGQMKTHGLGVGTLHMRAKKDNSKGYFETMPK